MPWPARTLIAIISLASGCATPDASTPAPGNTDAPAARVNPEAHANATYAGITDAPVTLSDGEWQGEPYVAGGAARPRVGLLRQFSVSGDMTNDGVDETIRLLWTNNGGSGTFDYLAVMSLGPSGDAYNLATAPLGDRVNLVTATIGNGILTVDVIQPGANDAACCPGQKFRRRFALEADTLKELPAQDRGRFSLADLEGHEWRLTQLTQDQPLPADIQPTLVVSNNTISGNSGCNRYSGSVAPGARSGEMIVSMQMAVTMMACQPPADDIERQYLQSLGGKTRYGFRAGQLILSGSRNTTDEPGSGPLIFDR